MPSTKSFAAAAAILSCFATIAVFESHSGNAEEPTTSISPQPSANAVTGVYTAVGTSHGLAPAASHPSKPRRSIPPWGYFHGSGANPVLTRLDDIAEQRAELIAELESILRTRYDSERPVEANHKAAQLLAEFQAPVAIEFLVWNASHEEPSNFSFNVLPHEHQRNLRALVKYGEAITPPVLFRVAKTPTAELSQHDLNVLSYALLLVYGYDASGRDRVISLIRAEQWLHPGNENLERFAQTVTHVQQPLPGR